MSSLKTSPAAEARDNRSPMSWVTSLYFMQGMQFFAINVMLTYTFKDMGVPNEQITRWTAVLGLAWAFKPVWSPFLELLSSKKIIVVAMQFSGAALLALAAAVLHTPWWFAGVLCVLFVMSFTSATHDIACDGLYMSSLDHERQARYAGWQGAFFNGGRFFIIGGVLTVADVLQKPMGVFNAWSAIFIGLAAVAAVLAGYNTRALPGRMSTEHSDLSAAAIWETTREIIVEFFRKPGIWVAVLFIVLFRFAEGQVQTVGQLFLVDARSTGGLGLTKGDVAGIYGWVGTGAFLVGSVLGGYFTAWLSLRRAMPVLLLAMCVPNATFYYLSVTQPQDMWHIGGAVLLEMFGYGFGFVGMILYIMQAVAPGRFQTAHYALGSGVMQLGFIFSRSISGDIQVKVGYEHFFLWTLFCGLPVLLMLPFIRIPGKGAKPAEVAATPIESAT
ncbi:MFS transporter [Mitsuaria sp. 7]|uniref:MFS transporter n=1 Tax=Mitsuaria sp. 7 TaxID=1658665 RepID=UPI0007DCBA97|nr:MFS transporter [Mitsuaria sp. 7]ANH69344.1 major facilitator transporter [Mitsuaria sp. 7]